MLDEIKKIQGITHTDFDTMINTWIKAGKQDLINIGVKKSLVDTLDTNNPDSLLSSIVITYVLSQLDVINAELYANSYSLQKDTIRRVQSYQEVN